MKQTPLKHYRPPKYPELTHENEESVRLLLKRQMPARWKRLAASAAALCAVSGFVEGCSPDAAQTEWSDQQPQRGAAGAATNTVAVAPLSPLVFEHGRGTFGCVALTPPVYLGEDEAKEIICDELAKAGIRLQPGMVLRREDKDQESAPGFCVDWVDLEKDVAIELMTLRDSQFWGDEANRVYSPVDTRSGSTAKYIDFGRSASFLSETAARFRSDRPLTLGIFTLPLIKLSRAEWRECYRLHKDPGWVQRTKLFLRGSSPFEEGQKKWKAHLKATGRDGEPELRAQVKYFVKWLEEQEKKQ